MEEKRIELKKQESLLKSAFSVEREMGDTFNELLEASDPDTKKKLIVWLKTYENLQLQIGEIIFKIAQLSNSNEFNAYIKLLIKSDRSQSIYHKFFKLII